MKKLLLAAALITGVALAEAQTVYSLGQFDMGRTRGFAQAPGTDLAQWSTPDVGVFSVYGNVGWNPGNTATWWTTFAFGGPNRSTNIGGTPVSGADLFNDITAATSVSIDLSVLWIESAGGFATTGVDVALWLVPGLDIADGTFPDVPQTLYTNYANAQQFATIDASTAPRIATGWTDWTNQYAFGLADQAAREANKISYDFTAEWNTAVTNGWIDASTTWGIVAFVDGVDPSDPNFVTNDLIPNAPAGQGTVLDFTTASLTVPEPSTYAAIFGFLALVGVMIRRRLKK